MTEQYEYELNKAAMNLASGLLEVKEGENVVITADTQSDFRAVDAVASAVFTLGARPMVITHSTPLGVGKAADSMLPMEPLAAALSKADVWVELDQMWLLYSTAYEIAMRENKKLRHVNMVGMNVDMLVRLVARVNTPALSKFLHKVSDMTQAAREMHVTTPGGTDLIYKMRPTDRIVLCDDGLARTPGSHFLAGQICYFPNFDSIRGRLVFDGSITPPCGLLSAPVTLDIEGGRAVRIGGGKDAEEFRSWLESFDDPNMFRIAHGCYGFHPGASLTGNVIEDERVWGCSEWGLGYISAADSPPDGIPAKSHTDGVCLNSSVWLDGVQILENGKVVNPELIPLADPLFKS
jgi:2,5-dihydroxypyridine 5,6-dioxygenase